MVRALAALVMAGVIVCGALGVGGPSVWMHDVELDRAKNCFLAGSCPIDFKNEIGASFAAHSVTKIQPSFDELGQVRMSDVANRHCSFFARFKRTRTPIASVVECSRVAISIAHGIFKAVDNTARSANVMRGSRNRDLRMRNADQLLTAGNFDVPAFDERIGLIGINSSVNSLAAGDQSFPHVEESPDRHASGDDAYYYHPHGPERHIPLSIQILLGCISFVGGAALFHKAFSQQTARSTDTDALGVPLGFLLMVSGALAVATGIVYPSMG